MRPRSKKSKGEGTTNVGASSPGPVVLPKYLKKTSVYHNNEAKVNNVKSLEFLSWHNIGLSMGSLQLFVL